MKEFPAVYIFAKVTLRQRIVFVDGLYCVAATEKTTSWWRLKDTEGYFFILKEEKKKKLFISCKGFHTFCC